MVAVVNVGFVDIAVKPISSVFLTRADLDSTPV